MADDLTKLAVALIRQAREQSRTGIFDLNAEVDVDPAAFSEPGALGELLAVTVGLAAGLADELDARDVGAGSAILFHAERA